MMADVAGYLHAELAVVVTEPLGIGPFQGTESTSERVVHRGVLYWHTITGRVVHRGVLYWHTITGRVIYISWYPVLAYHYWKSCPSWSCIGIPLLEELSIVVLYWRTITGRVVRRSPWGDPVRVDWAISLQ